MTELQVSSGAPQGSVLGLILFLLYINDMPDNIQFNVHLFADDTAVYLTVQGQEDANILQDDLNVLQEWEKAWDMEFNPSKCQVLHKDRSRRPIKHSYTMHRQVLDSIDHARYLGVDISSDLNFNHHINRATAIASKSLGFLKSNIKTKYPVIHEVAYKTTVRPQVENASSVWSPYTKKYIHKVEMVQRRATRWILSSYSPYQSVMELQQQQIRVDAKAIMMFKIIHGLVTIPVPPCFMFWFQQIKLLTML